MNISGLPATALVTVKSDFPLPGKEVRKPMAALAPSRRSGCRESAELTAIRGDLQEPTGFLAEDNIRL